MGKGYGLGAGPLFNYHVAKPESHCRHSYLPYSLSIFRYDGLYNLSKCNSYILPVSRHGLQKFIPRRVQRGSEAVM